VNEHHAQLIILDDGFQHRRLARDLDIVMIDALNPWGYGHLLPRGLLREPISSLRRAHLVAITRVDQVSPEQLNAIRQRVAAVRSDLPVIEVAFPPLRLINASGQTADFASLRSQPVVAFCGIGHPQAFFSMLEREQIIVRETRVVADHHAYSLTDVAELGQWCAACTGGQSASGTHVAVITTQKDLVKFHRDELGGRPLWAVEIGAKITRGSEVWDEMAGGLIAAGV
jgi:tetraacyldisaccharide 4'-kinase